MACASGDVLMGGVSAFAVTRPIKCMAAANQPFSDVLAISTLAAANDAAVAVPANRRAASGRGSPEIVGKGRGGACTTAIGRPVTGLACLGRFRSINAVDANAFAANFDRVAVYDRSATNQGGLRPCRWGTLVADCS